jgi:hypothetical protein
MAWRLVGVALAVSALAQPALARGPEPVRAPAVSPPGAECSAAIVASERKYGITKGLLAAIGMVESGRPDPVTGRATPWPWTINVEGQGYFYDSKIDAIAAVQAFQARGIRSIDVGCVQINLLHHPNAFATLDEAFDPQSNAAYGARFLKSLYAGLGDWANAAAAYHSMTPEVAAPYRERVMAVWTGKPYVYNGALMPKPYNLNADVYGAWPPPGMAFAAIPPSSFAFGGGATQKKAYGNSASLGKPYASSIYIKPFSGSIYLK